MIKQSFRHINIGIMIMAFQQLSEKNRNCLRDASFGDTFRLCVTVNWAVRYVAYLKPHALYPNRCTFRH